MAGRSENAFEVLSREEAAPEVEHPATMVTNADVKAGLAKTTTEGVPHVAAGQVGGVLPALPPLPAGCWLLVLPLLLGACRARLHSPEEQLTTAIVPLPACPHPCAGGRAAHPCQCRWAGGRQAAGSTAHLRRTPANSCQRGRLLAPFTAPGTCQQSTFLRHPVALAGLKAAEQPATKQPAAKQPGAKKPAAKQPAIEADVSKAPGDISYAEVRCVRCAMRCAAHCVLCCASKSPERCTCQLVQGNPMARQPASLPASQPDCLPA
jgi:hypothetical protein